ncbi:NADPH:quinone reductase-like Zn-dependent oxidoreductase [Paenibacillus phyllosphaerae]|uniref:NADPH:quinone reductase-like Zn-dependent oxidoreductase n=1 Tax=Paenibacillus phyllosphaerae TaxID=274593 RepID=A0A7W5AZS8_9BACL|nr:zinc-binding dehydrogenase [Paenibacillus phyllosphaerae]MBB3111474.1 NADPH:quinone reductase-like Zn-dependent oxidoreductase [Paenibacillus phyllosphaerae]
MENATMQAVVLDRPGTPDTMRLTELPIPEPGPGEIRIRVRAASLNPVDYKVAAGGHPNWTYPFVPGVDAAGVVDAVGDGVSEWKAGDRVVYHGDLSKPGGFAEYAITTAHTAAAIPEGLSFESAASFPCAGLTAYQALVRKMRLVSGQSIFIHAGAGGVGGYAIQLARVLGASQIVTSASPGNFDYVRSLGADAVIDYHTENVHDRIMALTNGRGVDCILNTINRKTAQEDLSLLAFGGQLTCIAGAPEVVADFQPSWKTFTVHKLMLGGAHGSGDRSAQEDLARMADEIMALLLNGSVDPMISETIQLDQVPEALMRLSQRHVRGKIVVTP